MNSRCTHANAFLKYLHGQIAFQRCLFLGLFLVPSEIKSLYIYFNVQHSQSKLPSSHSCLVTWMLLCSPWRVREAEVYPWGQYSPSCEWLFSFSHFPFSASVWFIVCSALFMTLPPPLNPVFINAGSPTLPVCQAQCADRLLFPWWEVHHPQCVSNASYLKQNYFKLNSTSLMTSLSLVFWLSSFFEYARKGHR